MIHKYYLAEESELKLGVESRPSQITVNGKRTFEFRYDAELGAVIVTLPSGEGTIMFR